MKRYEISEVVVSQVEAALRSVGIEPTISAVASAMVAAIGYLGWFHTDTPHACLVEARDLLQEYIDRMPEEVRSRGKSVVS